MSTRPQAFSSRSLVLIASALSGEYGVRVQVSGKHAYVMRDKETNQKVINIPALDLQDQKYSTLIRGYLDHEVGHVRFTKEDRPNDSALVENLTNIYEDVYVERSMSECFPGCKRNLRKLAELIFDGSSATQGEELLSKYQQGRLNPQEAAVAIMGNVLNYILYRARSEAAPGLLQHLPAYKNILETIAPGLVDLIEPIMQRLPAEGVNTAANIALARETAQLIQDYFPAHQQQLDKQWQKDPSEEAGSVEAGSGEVSPSGAGSAEAGPGEASPSGAGSAEAGPGEASPSGAGSSEAGVEQRVSKKTKAVLKALEREANTGGMHDELNISIYISKEIDKLTKNAPNCASMDTCDRDGAYTQALHPSDVKVASQTSAALDAQLQGLLQTYALNRGSVGRVGKLNTHLLHRLAVGSERIFKRRTEKRGINTEVILVVDMSGSMTQQSKDKITSKALYAVMKSLRKIQGCTSSVIGFAGDTIVDILRPGKTLNTNMSIVARGGTHCGEALMQALLRFSPDPDTRKIVIMMTDGETYNKNYFKHVIASARRNAIELVGIGIVDDSISQYLPPTECCIIDNLGKLVPELFRILRTKFLGAV